MNKPYIQSTPKHTVIEKTALEMACTFYDAARSSGMKSKYKTPQQFARMNFTKFIPKAMEILIGIMGDDSQPDYIRNEIYEAIQERVNDPSNVMAFDNKLPDVDLKKLLDDTPEPPVIVNTQRFDEALERAPIYKPKDLN